MATRVVSVPVTTRNAVDNANRPRVTRKQVKAPNGALELLLREALSLAKKNGLLDGARDQIVRGRMPAKLVAEAKRKSGITSDSKLLEAALARIATEDNYWELFRSRRGTVDPDLDLEF